MVVYSVKRAKRGVSRALSNSPTIIGRSEDADVVLDDDQVSRHHARIELDEAGRPKITDLESFNGTYVNGQRCSTIPLTDGDVIRVGSHVLLAQLLTMTEWRRLEAAPSDHGAIKGDGVRTRVLLDDISRAARLDLQVLILGGSGVGKELVASEIHRRSGRKGDFVAVNCAALPEHLVESELFGHARGAFTGAERRSEGLFGEADGGTLFLDEIGEMPLPLQAKLLRALATGEIRPVGDTKSRTVDVRVVAATNVDLERAIDKGTFREDLYARLMAVVIDVQPLARRRDDIIALAEHFLTLDGDGVPMTPDAAEALLVHRWRFNVRELEQTVRVAGVAANRAGHLGLEHLPRPLQAPFKGRAGAEPGHDDEHGPSLPLHIARDAVPTSGELKEVLRYFRGNISRVSDFFGKDRRQVYRWSQKLSIDLEAFRESDEEDG